MRFGSFFSTLVASMLLTICIVSTILVTSAEVRTSPNYTLTSDSINFAGGLSTSSQYQLESTVGEIASGDSDSASYALRAGYQQMQAVFLSITTPTDVVMTPALGGLTGGTATGSTSVVVLTDSPSGYELTLRASAAPAMRQGTESIPDYTSGAFPNPDFIFTTGPTQAQFGFSPEGSDISARFRDNGVSCGVGALDTQNACWLGLATTPILIATGAANQPLGSETRLNFRVELGSQATVLSGEYVATTTLTALPL